MTKMAFDTNMLKQAYLKYGSRALILDTATGRGVSCPFPYSPFSPAARITSRHRSASSEIIHFASAGLFKTGVACRSSMSFAASGS